MAIQKGVIQFRGKVGNVVGMKNGFGTKDSAFMRELVTDIKNPQSDFQMNQRAKMLPAVLFRRQLESVISRAWEGTKYGGPSTREFMKYALKEPWENIPQLPKDSTQPIPGAYLVSRGSLAPVGNNFNQEREIVTTNLFVSAVAATTTVAEISLDLLEQNPQLREGDQLTFIMAYTPSEDIPYVVYTVRSMFIDTVDTTTVREKLNGIFPTISNNRLAFPDAETLTVTCLGGVCVLSRDGSTTSQRSTERFAINKSRLTGFFSDSLSSDVADTYRTSGSRTTIDWPYESSDSMPSQSTEVRISTTVQPSGGGTASGAGTYQRGDTVTVTATANSGYTFTGWYAGGQQVSTSATYTFEATASTVLTAQFEEEDRP